MGGCAVNMRAMHTIQSRKTMTKTKTKTLRDVTCRHRVTQSGPRTIVVAVEAVVQAVVVVVAFSCFRVGLRISHTSLCFVTVKGEISSKNAL